MTTACRFTVDSATRCWVGLTRAKPKRWQATALHSAPVRSTT